MSVMPIVSTDLLRRAIQKTQRFFYERQEIDGRWVAELEGDALLESETILLLTFLKEEDSELAKGCAKRLLETQLDDGGWEMYPGAGADVTNSVKAYFALKLTGSEIDSEPMRRARRTILRLGGADKVNSFTRFYLALLDQIPYEKTPAVPPQMILIPRWFPINIYAMSSWSRTIFVPLSIVSALQPKRSLPVERGIRELFVEEPRRWKPLVCPGKKRSNRFLSWGRFFRFADKTLWKCRRLGLTPLRRCAIERAKSWTLRHFERSDGPGAINPPIVWSLVALTALGYADDSPEILECRRQLDALVLRDESKGTAWLQPCKSPVWDSSLTLKSLLLSGLRRDDPVVRRGLDWLEKRQIKVPGDWSQTVRNVEPGGWPFEYHNDFYPDADDTAMALMVLGGSFADAFSNETANSPESDRSENRSNERTAGTSDRLSVSATGVSVSDDSMVGSAQSTENLQPTAKESAAKESADRRDSVRRGLNWLLAMQNRDGGWGAFDRDNSLELLCEVPFADHNAMIDPSTPDLTGRVLESLGRLGFRCEPNGEKRANSGDDSRISNDSAQTFLTSADPALIDRGRRAVRRAVEFIRKRQEPDGSWFGRWGTNYIYGTWQALTGLNAVGVPKSDEAVRAGANWLLTCRQPCGGWGESPDSYRDSKLRGQGEPTASQTAWAVLGLIAAGMDECLATENGVRFLIDRQSEDGSWEERPFTGTGFPQVFYLKYHFYPIYFPLMAISLFAARRQKRLMNH